MGTTLVTHGQTTASNASGNEPDVCVWRGQPRTWAGSPVSYEGTVIVANYLLEHFAGTYGGICGCCSGEVSRCRSASDAETVETSSRQRKLADRNATAVEESYTNTGS